MSDFPITRAEAIKLEAAGLLDDAPGRDLILPTGKPEEGHKRPKRRKVWENQRRRKMYEGIARNPEKRPANPRAEEFSLLILSGSNKSDAFRQVFPKSKNWKKDTVHREASHFYKVCEPRIEYLREETFKKAHVTRAEVLKILSDAIRAADVEDQPLVAVVNEMAKLQGWHAPEKQMNVLIPLPPDSDVLNLLR